MSAFTHETSSITLNTRKIGPLRLPAVSPYPQPRGAPNKVFRKYTYTSLIQRITRRTIKFLSSPFHRLLHHFPFPSLSKAFELDSQLLFLQISFLRYKDVFWSESGESQLKNRFSSLASLSSVSPSMNANFPFKLVWPGLPREELSSSSTSDSLCNSSNLSKYSRSFRISRFQEELSNGPWVPPYSLGNVSFGMYLCRDSKLFPCKWICKEDKEFCLTEIYLKILKSSHFPPSSGSSP